MFLCSAPDIDECLDQDHGCEDICVNAEGSFFCNCSDGFLLNIDGKACTGYATIIRYLINYRKLFALLDINECLGPDHGCEYSCENAVGSFTCGCDVGFELNTDGRTCRGSSNHVTESGSYLACMTHRNAYLYSVAEYGEHGA